MKLPKYSLLPNFSKRLGDCKEELAFSSLNNGPLLSIWPFHYFYPNCCFHEKSRVHHFNCLCLEYLVLCLKQVINYRYEETTVMIKRSCAPRDPNVSSSRYFPNPCNCDVSVSMQGRWWSGIIARVVQLNAIHSIHLLSSTTLSFWIQNHCGKS